MSLSRAGGPSGTGLDPGHTLVKEASGSRVVGMGTGETLLKFGLLY